MDNPPVTQPPRRYAGESRNSRTEMELNTLPSKREMVIVRHRRCLTQ